MTKSVECKCEERFTKQDEKFLAENGRLPRAKSQVF